MQGTPHQTLVNRVHNLQRALGWKPQPKCDFDGWNFMRFVKAIRRLETTLLTQEDSNV